MFEGIVEELSVFRRALRGEDRFVFDSLMNKARAHASSCTVAPLLEPMDAGLSVDIGGGGEEMSLL
jgi:hypothetical protein